MLSYLHPNRKVKYAVGLIGALALAGCDGVEGQILPDGVTAAEVALFRAAVTDAGCIIDTPALGYVVETETGFDDDKLTIITQYLTLAGESTPMTSGFRLTSGSCANA